VPRWNRNGKRKDPLSRDERAARGDVGGPAPLQFYGPCPDCAANELSPPTLFDPESTRGRRMGRRRTFGCETCLGWGRVSLFGKHRLDQYMIAKKG